MKDTMKTKCKSLKLSILIFIISFILFTTFFFLNKYFECIWYEYFTNIFGSSFIVFLIAISEYRVAKTQVLEKIWNESRKLNIQFYKIKPFYSRIDTKLLSDYH